MKKILLLILLLPLSVIAGPGIMTPGAGNINGGGSSSVLSVGQSNQVVNIINSVAPTNSGTTPSQVGAQILSTNQNDVYPKINNASNNISGISNFVISVSNNVILATNNLNWAMIAGGTVRTNPDIATFYTIQDPNTGSRIAQFNQAYFYLQATNPNSASFPDFVELFVNNGSSTPNRAPQVKVQGDNGKMVVTPSFNGSGHTTTIDVATGITTDGTINGNGSGVTNAPYIYGATAGANISITKSQDTSGNGGTNLTIAVSDPMNQGTANIGSLVATNFLTMTNAFAGTTIDFSKPYSVTNLGGDLTFTAIANATAGYDNECIITMAANGANRNVTFMNNVYCTPSPQLSSKTYTLTNGQVGKFLCGTQLGFITNATLLPFQ